MAESEDVIQKSEVVARLIESDPHQWSTRPCQTCHQITAILGRPFGCYKRPLPGR